MKKVSFMIDYITNENLRRKIAYDLNKIEAINALARELFFGAEVHLLREIFVVSCKAQVSSTY